jgi:hypothetical protein
MSLAFARNGGAGFQTCVAFFSPTHPKVSRPAGLETGDTADFEVCATA